MEWAQPPCKAWSPGYMERDAYWSPVCFLMCPDPCRWQLCDSSGQCTVCVGMKYATSGLKHVRLGINLLNCGAGENSWESLRQQGDKTSQSQKKPTLNILWKDWCWSWSSNTYVIWYEQLTHWKRPWCWERLRPRGEGDDRGWDDRMAPPIQWTWVWANSGDGKGQGSLVWCNPWGHIESDITQWLNNDRLLSGFPHSCPLLE